MACHHTTQFGGNSRKTRNVLNKKETKKWEIIYRTSENGEFLQGWSLHVKPIGFQDEVEHMLY